MYVRKCLDLGWDDLAFGLACVQGHEPQEQAEGALEEAWSDEGLAALSVRSGFHLWLQACLALGRLEPGDEILVSAGTIPHMVELLRHHGLVPVPVDLDLQTCAPRLELLPRLATPRTQAFLVAHLFGARLDLDPISDACHELGITLWEDCAQAFVGDGWRGHHEADLSMFSFGIIKTATALGGGLLCVRDPALLRAMKTLRAAWPAQTALEYAERLAKAGAMLAITPPARFGAFVRACGALGQDYDAILMAATRGFPGAELVPRLQRRPSAALLRMMERRLARPSTHHLAARRAAGEALRARLPQDALLLGRDGERRSWWLFPVVARDPDRLVAALRAEGFDATRGGTSLCAVPDDERGQSQDLRAALARVVYLPVDRHLTPEALDKLAGLLVGSDVLQKNGGLGAEL